MTNSTTGGDPRYGITLVQSTNDHLDPSDDLDPSNDLDPSDQIDPIDPSDHPDPSDHIEPLRNYMVQRKESQHNYIEGEIGIARSEISSYTDTLVSLYSKIRMLETSKRNLNLIINPEEQLRQILSFGFTIEDIQRSELAVITPLLVMHWPINGNEDDTYLSNIGTLEIGRYRIRLFRGHEITVSRADPPLDSNYCHPHVSSTGTPCLGDSQLNIHDALDRGQYSQALLLLTQALQVYIRGDSYMSLAEFASLLGKDIEEPSGEEVTCDCCGRTVSDDDSYTCRVCGTICEDCSSFCEGCQTGYCNDHIIYDELCDRYYCENCYDVHLMNHHVLCSVCNELHVRENMIRHCCYDTQDAPELFCQGCYDDHLQNCTG